MRAISHMSIRNIIVKCYIGFNLNIKLRRIVQINTDVCDTKSIVILRTLMSELLFNYPSLKRLLLWRQNGFEVLLQHTFISVPSFLLEIPIIKHLVLTWIIWEVHLRITYIHKQFGSFILHLSNSKHNIEITSKWSQKISHSFTSFSLYLNRLAYLEAWILMQNPGTFFFKAKFSFS